MSAPGCDDVEPLLPLIADGAVQPVDEPAVFAHLAGCDRCQERLARHDLVTLALERSSPGPRTVRPRGVVVRLPLPWAAALAASLVAAVAVGWAVRADHRAAAADRALAASVPVAPSDTEVLAVPGGHPGEVVYVIRRGDRTVVVDPRSAPVQAEGAGDVPVGLRRY